MITTISTMTLQGMQAITVRIETCLSAGIGIHISGLASETVKEGLGRVRAALQACGFNFPRQRLMINMAPAGLPKSGSHYDLPIALGILLASGQVSDLGKLSGFVLAGELGLDGSLHPIRNSFSLAVAALQQGYQGILLPEANASEVSMLSRLEIYPIRHLRHVLDFLSSDMALPPLVVKKNLASCIEMRVAPDFADVRGQAEAKRALSIMAAGGHHGILIGPPGSGKTMLAQRLPSILPPMTEKELLEIMQLYSLAGQPLPPGMSRPFRAPHHHVTEPAMAGGGRFALPGEVSLAHSGVLFLDEFTLLKTAVLDTLRQPLEQGRIVIARSALTIEYPAAFTLLAAMNLPAGRHGLRQKIPAPVLDRIGLFIEMEPVCAESLVFAGPRAESSATIRQRILNARLLQQERFKALPDVDCNAQLPDSYLQLYCPLETGTLRFLLHKMKELHLSARAYVHILKLARTIADLQGSYHILLPHVAEAIHYRHPDKQFGGKPSSKQDALYLPGYATAV